MEIALEVPNGARLIGVKTTHPEDKLERQEETDAGKKTRWKSEFFAPEMDLKIHNRNPVILRVEDEFEGGRKAEDVAVDYRFLMGYQSGDPDILSHRSRQTGGYCKVARPRCPDPETAAASRRFQ
ncbi:hypothetical protein FBR05_09775 [Deltaproteobacteria bacterium PRO3]|nr:hypothetical protein [Deltaproteobacteria bacterium PRO3]